MTLIQPYFPAKWESHSNRRLAGSWFPGLPVCGPQLGSRLQRTRQPESGGCHTDTDVQRQEGGGYEYNSNNHCLHCHCCPNDASTCKASLPVLLQNITSFSLPFHTVPSRFDEGDTKCVPFNRASNLRPEESRSSANPPHRQPSVVCYLALLFTPFAST